MNEEYEYFDDGSAVYDEMSSRQTSVADSYPRENSDIPVAHARRADVETLSISDALQCMRRDANDFKNVAFTSETVAFVLLQSYAWSTVRARDQFFDQRDQVFKRLGINDESAIIEPTVQRNERSVVCTLCWDDVGPNSAVSLCACSHWLCLTCAHETCIHAIKHRADIVSKRCPVKLCTSFVGESFFRTVLAEADLEQYDLCLARNYLEGNVLVKWCGNRTGTCNSVIRVASNRDRSHDVMCSACQTRFCFNCSDDAHSPATCAMMKAWRIRAADESESVKWVAANTKDCPKCKQAIEKNGGCNHMTCNQCRHEWCWVCEGLWSKHGSSYYNCNFFDPNAAKEINHARDAAKESLRRYMFYYTRYENHLRSQKLDAKVMAQVNQRVTDAFRDNSNASVDLSRSLTETALVLFDCRHTLMYTYIYAFYLPEGCDKSLFEYQQSQLEFATEELSNVIEGTKAMDQQTVIDKTAIAKKFHQEMAKGIVTQA